MAVATVYAVTRPKPPPCPRTSGAHDRVPRITVLPFENLGRDDEQYVAAGLTEEITSRLAALDRLRLVSRAGAARYDRSSRRAGEIGADSRRRLSARRIDRVRPRFRPTRAYASRRG